MSRPSDASGASLDQRSKDLRNLAIESLDGGSRGHIGSTMSLIEIMRALYDNVLTFDAVNPALPDRDRLILSKGHGCIALYTLLADKGFFPPSELRMPGFLAGCVPNRDNGHRLPDIRDSGLQSNSAPIEMPKGQTADYHWDRGSSRLVRPGARRFPTTLYPRS